MDIAFLLIGLFLGALVGYFIGKNTIYKVLSTYKNQSTEKEILINQGILDNSISLLGKGENELAVNTPDETKHPANRRAEVKIIN